MILVCKISVLRNAAVAASSIDIALDYFLQQIASTFTSRFYHFKIRNSKHSCCWTLQLDLAFGLESRFCRLASDISRNDVSLHQSDIAQKLLDFLKHPSTRREISVYLILYYWPLDVEECAYKQTDALRRYKNVKSYGNNLRERARARKPVEPSCPSCLSFLFLFGMPISQATGRRADPSITPFRRMTSHRKSRIAWWSTRARSRYKRWRRPYRCRPRRSWTRCSSSW